MKLTKLLPAFALLCAATALTPAASAQTTTVETLTPAQVAQADSASRAMATVMGPLINKNLMSIQDLGVNINREAFIDALRVYLTGGDTGFTPQSADQYMDRLVYALHPEMAPQTMSQESQDAYLAEAAKAPGARVLGDGVVFITLQPGEGGHPQHGDKVTLQYVGQLTDGKIFDSTANDNSDPDATPTNDLGGSVEFDVDGVISGFTAGLLEMQPGGTYRIVIPPSQAYGPRGIPGAIPGNAVLDFTIRLLGIVGQNAQN